MTIRRLYREKRGISVKPVLFESINSYVFGDEDPNSNLADGERMLVSEVVRKMGGVVAEEELLPCLSEPKRLIAVMASLGGIPVLGDDGSILYSFEDLMLTAEAVTRRATQNRRPLNVYLREEELYFSSCYAGDIDSAFKFGACNLALSILLVTKITRIPDLNTFTQALSPILLSYAAFYIVWPLLRYLSLKVTNAAIKGRNDLRRDAALAIQKPSPDVQVALEPM